MKQIFKYSLPVLDEFTVEMMKGAKILCVQAQEGVGQMWAIVTEYAGKEFRTFKTIGTGHDVEDAEMTMLHYIGTYQSGKFVWHIFEKIK